MADYTIRYEEPVPPVRSIQLRLSEDEFKTIACLDWFCLGGQHPTREALNDIFCAIREDLDYSTSDMARERHNRINYRVCVGQDLGLQDCSCMDDNDIAGNEKGQSCRM